MSEAKESHAENGFTEKLARLRTKIDNLPASHRPHLHELADTIREQYDKQHGRRDCVTSRRASTGQPSPTIR